MKISIQTGAIACLMLLAAFAGNYLKPTVYLANEKPPIELTQMIPARIGEWTEERNVLAQVVNPQQKGMIDKIYNQTLSRTYINRAGYRIMLSIAYGKNQSDELALHKPEVCYPAQGFRLLSKQKGMLELAQRPVPITQLETQLGARREPVTYWTTVGENVVTNSFSKKKAEMAYTLRNRIPDGMLFRISSIDNNTQTAFRVHEDFAKSIAVSIADMDRSRFIGAKPSQL